MGAELLQSSFRQAIEEHVPGHRSHHAAPESVGAATSAVESGTSSNGNISFIDERCATWLDLTDDIKESCEDAVRILNDVLQYDKLKEGILELDVERVDMMHLIRKSVKQFSSSATKRNVELSLIEPSAQFPAGEGKDPEEDTSSFEQQNLHDLGDAVRLKQVMRNLLSNALKFAEGQVEVIVTYKPDGLVSSIPLDDSRPIDRGGSLRICVKDDGPGMEQAELQRLFGEGVQFRAKQLQGGGGSGLGLFISKGVILKHHGIIEAHSDGPGRGSTFVVELPLWKGAARRSSSDPTVIACDIQDGQDALVRCGRKILIVDDVGTNCKMISRLLERSGHSCTVAMNGQQALDAYVADVAAGKADVSHNTFDTILMDSEMPIMDGHEATSKLRRMGCKILIVGVSGNVLNEDVESFKSSGVDEVLPKPFRLDKLEEIWATRPKGIGSRD